MANCDKLVIWFYTQSAFAPIDLLPAYLSAISN